MSIDDVKLALPHFLDELQKGDDITKGHGHGYVLGFGHGKGDLGLQFGCPNDGASCIKYNPSTPRFSGARVRCCELFIPFSSKSIRNSIGILWKGLV